MKHRRQARELALDVLYEAEIRGSLPSEALEARESGGWVDAESGGDAGADPGTDAGSQPSAKAILYARELILGVQEHQAEIDETITRFADRWSMDRMPVVDRSLLRIGAFELLWESEVPTAVAINEAVELAKSYSTEDSGRFINGLLGRIAQLKDPA